MATVRPAYCFLGKVIRQGIGYFRKLFLSHFRRVADCSVG